MGLWLQKSNFSSGRKWDELRLNEVGEEFLGN